MPPDTIDSDAQHQLAQLLDEVYGGDISAIERDISRLRNAHHTMERPVKVTADHSNEPIVVEAYQVGKSYRIGRQKVVALDDVSLQIHRGEVVALLGKSGSGKSTLLHLLGGLDAPTSGYVSIDGINLKTMRDHKLSNYRGQKVGFVFQSFYLQPFLNVQDNIEVPAIFARMEPGDRHERSLSIARAVGLEDRVHHYGRELSGGQIQRVAIARALMNQPKIIMADEPTGNLDQQTARIIFDLFLTARNDFGATVLIVTHDEELALRADRIIRIVDGRIAP